VSTAQGICFAKRLWHRAYNFIFLTFRFYKQPFGTNGAALLFGVHTVFLNDELQTLCWRETYKFKRPSSLFSRLLAIIMPKAPAAILPAAIPSRPLTPLSDADPALANLSLTRKSAINDRRIREILVIFAGDPPDKFQPDEGTCSVGLPQLNVGKTNQMDAGRWFMRVCVYCPINLSWIH